jgi:phosphoglycerate dehydrogenase-like enzyme
VTGPPPAASAHGTIEAVAPHHVTRVITTLDLDDDARATLAAALAPNATLDVVRHSDDIAHPDAEVLLAHTVPKSRAGLPRLRLLQLTTAGVDHIDLGESWKGMPVATASGLFSVPIAEYVIGALFFIAQQVPARLDNARAHSWHDRWRLSGRPLAGTTMVLVGYGSIGREVARLAAALRIRIIAVKARPEARAAEGFEEPGTGDPDGSLPESIVGVDRLAEAVAQADWIVLSLPLTQRTRTLVDADVLAAVRDDAWLINVGRGAVVDEAALLGLLEARAIGGAVLDVFSEEPLPPEHPFWSAPGTVVTPHISGGLERPEVLAELIGQNVRRLAAGEPLLNVLAPARGY